MEFTEHKSNNDAIHVDFDKEDGKVTIFIKFISGRYFKIDIELEKTVDELLDIVNKQYGIIKDGQLVVCNGRQLQRNMKLLSYNIDNNSSIFFTHDKGIIAIEEIVQIFVKTLTGAMIVIDIDLNDTVVNAICILCKKGVAISKNDRLIFCGRELDTFRKLSYYGITGGSTLHMVLNMRGD
jgi:hypothetical protein